jgi:hypothetical protein
VDGGIASSPRSGVDSKTKNSAFTPTSVQNGHHEMANSEIRKISTKPSWSSTATRIQQTRSRDCQTSQAYAAASSGIRIGDVERSKQSLVAGTSSSRYDKGQHGSTTAAPVTSSWISASQSYTPPPVDFGGFRRICQNLYTLPHPSNRLRKTLATTLPPKPMIHPKTPPDVETIVDLTRYPIRLFLRVMNDLLSMVPKPRSYSRFDRIMHEIILKVLDDKIPHLNRLSHCLFLKLSAEAAPWPDRTGSFIMSNTEEGQSIVHSSGNWSDETLSPFMQRIYEKTKQREVQPSIYMPLFTIVVANLPQTETMPTTTLMERISREVTSGEVGTWPIGWVPIEPGLIIGTAGALCM